MTTIEAPAEFIEATLDLPIRYIDRSREYYLALGYDNPYRWAHNRDVPFAAMKKPIREARVAIVTTAAPYRAEAGDQGPWAPYNAEAKFTRVYSAPTEPQPDLRISHVGYDRKHTSAEDVNTFLPLDRAKEAAADGRIGHLNNASTRSRPSAVNASPSSEMRPRFSPWPGRTLSMRPSLSPPDRFATKPSV